jgi:hypothetical protein
MPRGYIQLGNAYPVSTGWKKSKDFLRAKQNIQFDPREANFEKIPFCQSDKPKIHIGHYGEGGNQETKQALNIKWASDTSHDGRDYADRCILLDKNSMRGMCNNMGYYSAKDVGPAPRVQNFNKSSNGSRYCKSAKPTINMGHYGPGGDGNVLIDPDMVWYCDDCNGRDMSDGCYPKLLTSFN